MPKYKPKAERTKEFAKKVKEADIQYYAMMDNDRRTATMFQFVLTNGDVWYWKLNSTENEKEFIKSCGLKY